MTTINKEEIQKFSSLANEWWDVKGKFKPLHMFNPIRIEYITQMIRKYFKISDNEINPFKKLKILDIGCGGGLISEPMARLGAKVTGIDASEKNINIAKIHSKESNLEINYINSSPEKLNEKEEFDIILNLEIIEHVEDVELYLNSCNKLLKKRWFNVHCDVKSNNNLIFKSNNWCRIYLKMASNWDSRLEQVYKARRIRKKTINLKILKQ